MKPTNMSPDNTSNPSFEKEFNSLFRFANYYCDYKIDVVHDENGVPNYSLLIRSRPIERLHSFAYKPISGLFEYAENTDSGKNKITTKDTVVEDFLSLDLSLLFPPNSSKSKDPIEKSGLLRFIDNYGLFFPVPHDYLKIDLYSLAVILKQQQIAVQLHFSLIEKDKDYNRIFEYVYKLLFCEHFCIKCTYQGREISLFENCIHPFTAYYNNSDNTPFREPDVPVTQPTIPVADYHGATAVPLEIDYNATSGVVTGMPDNEGDPYAHYFVNDTLTEKVEDITDEMCDSFGDMFIRQGHEELAIIYQRLGILYVNNTDESQRHIIDFLYHMIAVDWPLSFDLFSPLRCLHNHNLNTRLDWDLLYFHGRMNYKKGLERTAKQVLKEELEFYFRNIRLSYDTESAKLIWIINNLSTAIMYSIFYMDSNCQLFRSCKNCGKYFTVSRSNSKKKFCCSECQNAYNQKNYRKNHPNPHKNQNKT